MKARLSKYIAVDVTQYEKAIDFYTEVLGWDLIEYAATESKFKKNSNYIFLTNNPDTAGKVYFEYEVDDLTSAKTELKKAGCKILKTYSDKSVLYVDPYGMNFHVYEKGTEL